MSKREFSILHLTDLHINDPNSESEHLRQGGFTEYLDGLVNCIRRCHDGGLHAIVATGDFVDRGKVENLDHAATVVAYLAKELGLTEQDTAVCIGNHDVVRSLDEAGKVLEARSAYAAFAARFANRSPEMSCSRAILCRLANGIPCLLIDGTVGSQGKDRPGTMTIAEADEIVNIVHSVPGDELLLIGTHYFVETSPELLAPYERRAPEPDWFQRHFWVDAIGLRERIRRRRGKGATVWFCGDVHYSNHLTVQGHHFIVTGRLGTRVGKEESLIPRQAKIVTLAADSREAPGISIFTYGMPGQAAQAEYGDWRHEVDEVTVVEKRKGRSRGALTPPGRHPPEDGALVAEVIDADLERTLVRTIKTSGLYRLGRFETSESQVSLSWVSVGPLMNSGEILRAVLDKMSDWLDTQVRRNEMGGPDQTVLLGLDCWGAVLASQLSVRAGTWNFCIASRGHGKHYTTHEVISPAVIGRVNQCKTVVLVTDVVATGESLRYLHDEVVGKVDDEQKGSLNWLALSVICDPTVKRSIDFGFLSAHGTVCTALRMPIVPVTSLPGPDMLPPDLSFT